MTQIWKCLLQKAMDILSSCIKKFKNKKKISFLTGYSGPLALAAIIDDSLKGGKSQDFIQQCVFRTLNQSIKKMY